MPPLGMRGGILERSSAMTDWFKEASSGVGTGLAVGAEWDGSDGVCGSGIGYRWVGIEAGNDRSLGNSMRT